MAPAAAAPRLRAHRSFWALTCVAFLAMGALSTALAAPPGALTGLLVAVSGVVLVAALALAARVLLALERAHRLPRDR